MRFIALLALSAALAVQVPGPIARAASFAEPDPQCMGDKFKARADDASVAARLMNGRLTMDPHRVAKLRRNPRWSENPFDNANWVFQYQTLRWADVLRREGVRTGNMPMIRRYVFLVRDWLRDNPYRRARSRLAWSDMAVGVRAISLICAAQVAGDEPWLRPALIAHGHVLADPKEYRRIGNHALHQNIGLLALGCHTGRSGWQDLAARRTAVLLERSVDHQGVTDEGSTMYQYLNYLWYSQVPERNERCGRPADASFERLDLMPAFLGHATKPDGTLVGLGDSDPSWRSIAIAGTLAEFAATRGASGTRPTVLAKNYHRGYTFSRSSWGTTPPLAPESFMSVRYGPALDDTVHGHEDAGSITFSALGRDILWEQGQWGGSGGPNRTYVRSNDAHNVVDIPGAEYRRDRASSLVAKQIASSHHLVTVRSRNLEGAVWTRTVVHALAPGFLIVDDRVTQSASRPVVQRWHLGADRKVKLGDGRAGTSGVGSDATFLWAGAQPSLSVVRGLTDPMLGWRSMHANEMEPAPVLQASRTGRTVRFTTVIVPRAAYSDPATIKIRRVVTEGGAQRFEVVIGRDVYAVRVSASSAWIDRTVTRAIL